MADGFYLSQSAVERLDRALRLIEQGGGPYGGNYSGDNYGSSPTLFATVAATGISPGSTLQHDFTRYQSTQAGGLPSKGSPTIKAVDWWGWGIIKDAKSWIFRPIPNFEWLVYQPPAARYGEIQSYTTGANFGTAVVHPADDLGGTVDGDSTFAVKVPNRTGVDSTLQVNDFISFIPDLYGGHTIVSDYSAASTSSAASERPPAQYGSLLVGHTTDITTNTTWKGLDSADIEPTTGQSGTRLATSGTVVCTTPGLYKVHCSAQYTLSTSTSTKGEITQRVQRWDGSSWVGVDRTLHAGTHFLGTTDPLGGEAYYQPGWTGLLDIFSSGEELRLTYFVGIGTGSITTPNVGLTDHKLIVQRMSSVTTSS